MTDSLLSNGEVADYLQALGGFLESIAQRLREVEKGDLEAVESSIELASTDLQFVTDDLQERAGLARQGQWERPRFLRPRGQGRENEVEGADEEG